MRTRRLFVFRINEGLYYLVIWGPVLCMLCIVATGTDRARFGARRCGCGPAIRRLGRLAGNSSDIGICVLQIPELLDFITILYCNSSCD
jgi:hypothetical protein